MDQPTAMPAEGPALTNPPRRAEIRPDFPQTINAHDRERILSVIGAELEKHGSSFDEVGHITIAYPHKHPEKFPNYRDQAKDTLEEFKETLEKMPDAARVDWLTADGLVETVSLGRSENQTSLHALMLHQHYEVHAESQTTPLPFFARADKKEKEFFVIVDWVVAQGTTVANMMSYIEHNGGTVLAVVEGQGNRAIAQVPFSDGDNYDSRLSAQFNDRSRNTAHLKMLGYALARAATKEGYDLDADACLTLLEEGLNKHGNSLFALTDFECNQIIEDIEGPYMKEPFAYFFGKLGVRLPAPGPKPREDKPGKPGRLRNLIKKSQGASPG